jgi:hypothetical protein
MKTSEQRKEIENLIKTSPEEISGNVPEDDMPELESELIMDVNFADLKSQCEKEARTMIKNNIQFIIPMDMIRESKYLRNKLEVDILSLAGMIYQLKTNEIMQKALIDQVNAGMVNPRMFEVFGQLSKIIGDLNKQLLQTTEAIKETYKSFKQDVREQRTESLGPQNSMGMITTGDGGIVTRGTKELINNVKRLKLNGEDNYIDDAKLIPNIDLQQSSNE